jgi:hypothetical protein
VALASVNNVLVLVIFEESLLGSEFSRAGISSLCVGMGMKIVGSLDIFMDLDSVFTNGDVGGMFVNPSSAIVIIDSLLVFVQRGMGVAAENAGRLTVTGIDQSALGDL